MKIEKQIQAKVANENRSFVTNQALLDGNQNTLILLGSIVVIAMANPYFLIPLWVLGTIFVSIRMIYLKTSKNIKRIEGIGKKA